MRINKQDIVINMGDGSITVKRSLSPFMHRCIHGEPLGSHDAISSHDNSDPSKINPNPDNITPFEKGIPKNGA